MPFEKADKTRVTFERLAALQLRLHCSKLAWVTDHVHTAAVGNAKENCEMSVLYCKFEQARQCSG